MVVVADVVVVLVTGGAAAVVVEGNVFVDQYSAAPFEPAYVTGFLKQQFYRILQKEKLNNTHLVTALTGFLVAAVD